MVDTGKVPSSQTQIVGGLDWVSSVDENNSVELAWKLKEQGTSTWWEGERGGEGAQ